MSNCNNIENELLSNVGKKTGDLKGNLMNHIKNLHQIAQYALSREFSQLYSYIDSEYFHKKVFDDTFYKSADDFVFRMDITSLSYGQVLQLAYQDLQKEGYAQFLLGLKIIIVKLKGNQRYSYYDRDEILDLLNEMKTDFSYEYQSNQNTDMLDILIEECQNYLPIGFQEMTLEEYHNGSTRSSYNSYKKLEEKLLEAEFSSAIKQGNIYHHIIEIDHYINRKEKEITQNEWIFLAKLLSAHYATEKKPWTRDMTTDLLRTFIGIRDLCDHEGFNDTLLRLVTGTLKIIIKKISSRLDSITSVELTEIINYLVNVYTLDNNNQYLVYINEFLKMLDKSDSSLDQSDVNKWLEQQT